MELAAVSVQLLVIIPVIAMPALEARARLEARGRAARPEKAALWREHIPTQKLCSICDIRVGFSSESVLVRSHTSLVCLHGNVAVGRQTHRRVSSIAAARLRDV